MDRRPWGWPRKAFVDATECPTSAAAASPHPYGSSCLQYDWSTPELARHSLRVICDEEGLTVDQKNLMSQVVHCESGYNPKRTHANLKDGKQVSCDYGIVQINDYYHIGPGKDFPSVDYVLNNPEACVRWMSKMVKAGKINMWVCYTWHDMYKKSSVKNG